MINETHPSFRDYVAQTEDGNEAIPASVGGCLAHRLLIEVGEATTVSYNMLVAEGLISYSWHFHGRTQAGA